MLPKVDYAGSRLRKIVSCDVFYKFQDVFLKGVDSLVILADVLRDAVVVMSNRVDERGSIPFVSSIEAVETIRLYVVAILEWEHLRSNTLLCSCVLAVSRFCAHGIIMNILNHPLHRLQTLSKGHEVAVLLSLQPGEIESAMLSHKLKVLLRQTTTFPSCVSLERHFKLDRREILVPASTQMSV